MEMVVQIVGVPSISALMTISNWWPLGISSVMLVVAGIMAFTLPESHPQYRSAVFGPPSPLREQHRSSDQDENADSDNPEVRTARKEVLHALKTIVSILKNPVIWPCLSVFLLACCGAHSWALLVQYVSQRFRWEYSTVSLHSDQSGLSQAKGKPNLLETGKPSVSFTRLYHHHSILGHPWKD